LAVYRQAGACKTRAIQVERLDSAFCFTNIYPRALTASLVNVDLDPIWVLLEPEYERNCRYLARREDDAIEHLVPLTFIATQIVWQGRKIVARVRQPGLAAAFTGQPKITPIERPVVGASDIGLWVKVCDLLVVLFKSYLAVGAQTALIGARDTSDRLVPL
jgi:hypothetical protein